MSTIDLEHIRARNPIEEVVREKFELKKSGSHFVGVEHDSLVVNPRTGWYHWNSRDERGDVFDFVGRQVLPGNWNSRDPLAFMEAVRYLAKRAGIPLAENGDLRQSAAWNERELIRRLQQALVEDKSALQYVTQTRGWNQDNLRVARIGFVPEDKNSLLGGLDLGEKWRQVILGFPNGMVAYIHVDNGRLAYLSGRSIKVKRHYNPPRDIIGERQPYLNHCYRTDSDEVVIVEGQADAITFGEWDTPAIALGGMSLSDAMLARLRQHHRIHVLLDNTPEARTRSLEIARDLGPNACLPQLPEDIKDANEWLAAKRPETEQVKRLLNDAQTLIDCEVDHIRSLHGLARQDAIENLIERAASWDKAAVSKLKFAVRDRLDVSLGLFNEMLKASREVQAINEADEAEANPQILGDDIPLISPALGFTPDMAVMTVSIMERTSDNRLNLQPYLVTSRRELRRLGKQQVIPLNGHEAALRVVPEGSEFLMRWRYQDIQRFLEGETVEPGDVFTRIHNHFARFVDFSTEVDSRIVALWVIGTYFYTLFVAYPYLALNGPKNSGKSTVLNAAKPLAFNMITTSDITGPSLFRLIHHNACTVGIDEAERYYSPRSPEMQQIKLLLNSGYKPGMPAIRLMGEEMKPQAFDVYSPKILANIAGLEDVLASRCIPIPMRRTDRKIVSFPPTFDGATMRHLLYTLALTAYPQVRRNYFERPDLHRLTNRSNELWSPLVALAAFFEEVGQAAGLLDAIREAADRDQIISSGKSLNDRDEALLQGLELLTRGHEGSVVWLKARDLREAVQKFLGIDEDQAGSAQWVGHSLRRLQLTDNARCKRHNDGPRYAIRRAEVLDLMRRYAVSEVEDQAEVVQQ